jgi:hypothetical protein
MSEQSEAASAADAADAATPVSPAAVRHSRPHRPTDAAVPGWLVRHPLIAGWAWTAFWIAVIAADEFLDFAGWVWFVFVALCALPTLVATLVVLQATPREHLKPQAESVLAHFVVRFLTLVAAFVLWGVSLIISASISTTLQAAIGSEREVTTTGFQLLLTSVPLVVSVLWMALIVRCAWFLRRLRGWRQHPARSRVPTRFLRDRPLLRTVVIGLAHPGLLLVAGLGASILALLLASVEMTLNVFV